MVADFFGVHPRCYEHSGVPCSQISPHARVFCRFDMVVPILGSFNGRQLFLDSAPVVDVQTDACYEAAGVFFNGDQGYYNFFAESPAMSDLHINYKEVLAVIFAAERWAPLWSCKHVIIHSGSQAAVGIINKGSTKNALIMGFLRRLFWLSAIYNFRITARYVKGAHNVIADAISRMHIPSFLLQAYSFISTFPHCIAVLSHNLLLHMPYSTALFLFFRYSSSHFSKGTQC